MSVRKGSRLDHSNRDLTGMDNILDHRKVALAKGNDCTLVDNTSHSSAKPDLGAAHKVLWSPSHGIREETTK